MKKFIYIIRLFFTLVLCLWLPAANAIADPASFPTVSGTIIRNDARITFEWPKPVNFVAKADGKTITITFERPVSPDFGSLLASLYPYVKSVRTLRDGKSITFALNKPYKIRTFLTDNIGGIDLLAVDLNERPNQQNAPKNNPRNALAGASPDDLANLSPTEGKAPSSPTGPATTTPSAEVAQAPAEDAEKSDVAEHQKNLKINVSAAKDSAVIRLPFIERAAIAAFIRDNYLWIVLDKAYSLDLSDFDNLQKTVVGRAELLEAKQSIIRIPVDDNIFVSVAKEESSFEWAVLLTQGKHPPAHALEMDINTDPPTPPNVFVKSLQMSDPITIADPLVGDELVVTPLYTLGEGVGVGRDFVEFTLLPSAQGIAIIRKADDVTAVALRNGLRVSMPQGATLTPGLPPVKVTETTASLKTVPTFFPYEKWRLPTDKPERIQLRMLFHAIVENDNHREANEQRIKLAQIYLGEGLATEALGILGGIDRTDPIFYRSAKLAALHGVANFMMYRFSEAARDFAASELNNNKEIEFWRSMLADLLGTPTPYDYLGMDVDYISKYPPLFRQRLAIVAANHVIDEKNYNMALKIFDTLQPNPETKQEDLTVSIKPYLNYLLAKIATETGQADDGVNTWSALAQDYNNPFIQSHADFSKIIWDFNHGTTDKDHTIEKLERLRLAWHGDAMELKVLELLGNLYNDKKDYVNAMRIWDGGVSSFPSTPTAIEMTHHMRDTFGLMFSEEATVNIPPMDELVLYYQYRKYAPPTGADKEITDRLADRLVGIDLLEQATSLLDHEMRTDVGKEQRSRVGAKIASVHLLAHEPQKALQALEDSVYGEISGPLHLLRNRIAAQAFLDNNELEKAKQIIARDDSLDAERIRTNIYWQQKDWPHLITSAESTLKTRKNLTEPLTLDESETVIRLALAYIFQSNMLQLQYLHDYFGPLMAKNQNKPLFDFITATDVTPTPTNFDDVIKRLSETRSFIKTYQARIQIAGADTAAQKPNTPATVKQ